MKARVITAIIALPFALLPIWVGGGWLYILLMIASAIGFFEFNRAFDIKEKSLWFFQLLGTGALFMTHALNEPQYVMAGGLVLLIMGFVLYIIRYPKIRIEAIMLSVFAFVYIGVTLYHVLLIRGMETIGFHMIWLVLLISFGSDTFAYLVGSAMGKHKLAPLLSPNKSIEGAVGGLLGSVALTVIYIILVNGAIAQFTDMQIVGFAIMGLIGSIVSQLGDLSASAIKRARGIKDFGKLLPGHGGILDRVDSILFVTPFVYYVTLIILGV